MYKKTSSSCSSALVACVPQKAVISHSLHTVQITWCSVMLSTTLSLLSAISKEPRNELGKETSLGHAATQTKQDSPRSNGCNATLGRWLKTHPKGGKITVANREQQGTNISLPVTVCWQGCMGFTSHWQQAVKIPSKILSQGSRDPIWEPFTGAWKRLQKFLQTISVAASPHHTQLHTQQVMQ